MLRIGIDIGGTFTDFVIYDPRTGSYSSFKLLTDTVNPAKTVLLGLDRITKNQPAFIIHGSTVATNALLEGKGAITALITTQGFKDILQIGRQNRPDLYDLFISLPKSIIPHNLRFEINERVDSKGRIIKKLAKNKLTKTILELKENHVQSVAVCLLYSFLYPNHEHLIAQALRKAGFSVSASCDILPEFREFERMSTTVVNAYVSPILDVYLFELESALPGKKIQIMQSNGGMIDISEARTHGVRCILSGPAGGIVGAKNIVEASSLTKIDETGNALSKIITFDMGGTSTDVSLINKEPTFTTDLCIGGYPIHLPVLDIHTIGAGGGSIAYVDAGGSLRVGPQSAGAHPGPACYGIGESPTVTDANLVLGRLIPDYFLGGNMKLFPEKALASIKKLGDQLGLDLIRTANGIIDVVNIQMEHALRLISVERGHDPREYDLFSFGGAGGLHACALARHVGIPRVIIPKHASTLSAYGMLTSNVIKDYVLTVMLPGTTSMEKIREIMQPLIDRSRLEMRKQGYLARQTEIQTSLDMRYVGQSYELNIPFSNNFTQDFQAKHSFTFGYHFQDKSIEIVNIRVKAIGINPSIQFPAIKKTKKASKLEPVKFIDVFLNYKKSHIPLFLFDRLIPGNQIKGPSLIVSDDTTIFIDQENDVFVDNYLNLIININ